MNKRERSAKIEAVKRVVGSEDFLVFRSWIEARITTEAKEIEKLLVTPADIAGHNFSLGVVAALREILRLGEAVSQVPDSE